MISAGRLIMLGGKVQKALWVLETGHKTREC